MYNLFGRCNIFEYNIFLWLVTVDFLNQTAFFSVCTTKNWSFWISRAWQICFEKFLSDILWAHMWLAQFISGGSNVCNTAMTRHFRLDEFVRETHDEGVTYPVCRNLHPTQRPNCLSSLFLFLFYSCEVISRIKETAVASSSGWWLQARPRSFAKPSASLS